MEKDGDDAMGENCINFTCRLQLQRRHLVCERQTQMIFRYILITITVHKAVILMVMVILIALCLLPCRDIKSIAATTLYSIPPTDICQQSSSSFSS